MLLLLVPANAPSGIATRMTANRHAPYPVTRSVVADILVGEYVELAAYFADIENGDPADVNAGVTITVESPTGVQTEIEGQAQNDDWWTAQIEPDAPGVWLVRVEILGAVREGRIIVRPSTLGAGT